MPDDRPLVFAGRVEDFGEGLFLDTLIAQLTRIRQTIPSALRSEAVARIGEWAIVVQRPGTPAEAAADAERERSAQERFEEFTRQQRAAWEAKHGKGPE